MSLYNLRNPAVKRLMKEAEELCHPTDEYHAQPLEDNLFEWHFSIRGPPNSDFEGGIYHGRITLPPDYPMKPPSIILLTPNGRFETNKKICLSISGYHPESWQPSWSIRTALLAIIGFMPTHGNGALGSLDYTPAERKELALKSEEFKCSECGYIKDIFMKKKSSECAKNAPAPNSLSNIVNQVTMTTITSPGRTCNGSSSETHVSAISTLSNDETHSVVYRHKTSESTVISDKTSHIEKVSDCVEKSTGTQVTVSENRHNLFYLLFIFFIVSILLFLILRRIFCM